MYPEKQKQQKTINHHLFRKEKEKNTFQYYDILKLIHGQHKF